jgi:hypothetical protein
MATLDTFARRLAGLIAATGFTVSELFAAPAWTEDNPVQMAQGGVDCYAIGEQVAAQYGGTLARATPANRGGQIVCQIVVLVPGKGGGRPRRVQVVVPAR